MYRGEAVRVVGPRRKLRGVSDGPPFGEVTPTWLRFGAQAASTLLLLFDPAADQSRPELSLARSLHTLMSTAWLGGPFALYSFPPWCSVLI